MGGAFQLKPNETVIHPMPFVPTDPYRLIVTTQRLVHIDKKRVEIPAAAISFTGRTVDRPYFNLCVLLALIALPCLIIGLVLKFTAGSSVAPPLGKIAVVTTNGKPDGPAAPLKYQSKAYQDIMKQRDQAHANKIQGYEGLGLIILAAGCGMLLKRLWKKAYYVIVSAGQGLATKIKTKSEAEQSQLLTTIQSAHTAAKLIAGKK
jgi:hypothetical protein